MTPQDVAQWLREVAAWFRDCPLDNCERQAAECESAAVAVAGFATPEAARTWEKVDRESWFNVARDGEGWFVVGPMSAYCTVDKQYYRFQLPPLPQQDSP